VCSNTTGVRRRPVGGLVGRTKRNITLYTVFYLNICSAMIEIHHRARIKFTVTLCSSANSNSLNKYKRLQSRELIAIGKYIGDDTRIRTQRTSDLRSDVSNMKTTRQELFVFTLCEIFRSLRLNAPVLRVRFGEKKMFVNTRKPRRPTDTSI